MNLTAHQQFVHRPYIKEARRSIPEPNPIPNSIMSPQNRNNEIQSTKTKKSRSGTVTNATVVEESGSGREKLKRHRVEVAGRVWIPEIWGQEDFLKNWTDCAVFDSPVMGSTVVSARASLVEQGRNANSAAVLAVKNL